jgi:hypothetical protein
VIKPKRGRWKLKAGCPKNEKSKKILENYREITVDANWYEYFQSEGYNPPDHNSHPNEPVSQYGCYLHSMYLINSILKKEISVKSDKPCGRLFHPVVELPSSLRPYLQVRGERMVEIDAESFHPHLIACIIKDKCRRERYLDCVGKGIYELFVDSQYPRSKVKSSFQKFLAGKPTDSKSKQVRNWYGAEYPEVTNKMKELKQQGITFQMHLQQLESSIFVDGVFMKSDFWCLPLHDGLAVLQEDTQKAEDLINAAFDELLGYRIPLKTK